MSVFFAEVFAKPYGGAWQVAETAEKALRGARSTACETAKTERGSYVLEFADDAEPTGASDLYGGWRAKACPIRVVSKNKIKASDGSLMGNGE